MPGSHKIVLLPQKKLWNVWVNVSIIADNINTTKRSTAELDAYVMGYMDLYVMGCIVNHYLLSMRECKSLFLMARISFILNQIFVEPIYLRRLILEITEVWNKKIAQTLFCLKIFWYSYMQFRQFRAVNLANIILGAISTFNDVMNIYGRYHQTFGFFLGTVLAGNRQCRECYPIHEDYSGKASGISYI